MASKQDKKREEQRKEKKILLYAGQSRIKSNLIKIAIKPLTQAIQCISNT